MDLIILNSPHGVLVGMVIKLSGQVAHTNHLCGPELNNLLVSNCEFNYHAPHGYNPVPDYYSSSA